MLAVLAGAGSASALSLTLEYGNLAAKRMRPAPLVPTTAPKVLQPLTLTLGQISASRKAYRIRLTDLGTRRPTALIALDRGDIKSVAQAVKEGRGNGLKIRTVRIRGTKGKLFTDGRGRTTFYNLVWKEKGAVYQAGTGTTKTVSYKALLSFVKGLEAIEPEWVATPCTGGKCQGVIVVTTRSTASVLLEWEATCDDPEGKGQYLLGYAGSRSFPLLPRRGNGFAFNLAPGPGQPWTINGTGAVRADGVGVDVRASGVPQGRPCDTGQLALDANQRFSP